MTDDRLDDLVGDSAGSYNDPPETPREEMWQRIVAARQTEKVGGAGPEEKSAETQPRRDGILPFRRLLSVRYLHPARPVRLAAGIAALLALGIGLGRMSVDRQEGLPLPEPVAVAAPRISATAYRLTTTEHLSQSEAFLTLFRASVRNPGNERIASATARQLLATNRLLLDSPAASDARTRLLLQDLELVLAEIAQLSPQPRSRDLQLITEGMEQGGVLSRLRTAVPAGTSSTQGAL
jgi:hypothetical protein